MSNWFKLLLTGLEFKCRKALETIINSSFSGDVHYAFAIYNVVVYHLPSDPPSLRPETPFMGLQEGSRRLIPKREQPEDKNPKKPFLCTKNEKFGAIFLKIN